MVSFSLWVRIAGSRMCCCLHLVLTRLLALQTSYAAKCQGLSLRRGSNCSSHQALGRSVPCDPLWLRFGTRPSCFGRSVAIGLPLRSQRSVAAASIIVSSDFQPRVANTASNRVN